METREEVFPLGSVVQCKTCSSQQLIEGEVLGFDHNQRVLALRLSSTNGTNKCSINFLNLAFVETVEVIKEAAVNTPPLQMPAIQPQKLEQRLKAAIRNKINSIAPAGVTVEGQKTFVAIRRTLDDVQWQEDRIIVFQSVAVHPPYGVEDVRIINETQNNSSTTCNLLQHVKKIVDREHSRPDQSASALTSEPQSPDSTTSYSSAVEKVSDPSNGPTPPPNSN